VERLYAIIENLKSRKIALLFVSHKLDEVFRIAQHITIMRNGQNVTEGPVESFDMKSLTYHMTGKEQHRAPFGNVIEKDRVILKCENMRAKNDSFRNINFELYKGEVLGITGLLGSGRESLAEALFGLQRCKEGDMVLCGQKLKLKNASQAVREGIGYIPEDRTVKGLYLNATIGENIISSVLFIYARLNFLMGKTLQKVAQTESGNLRIKAWSLDTLASSLSGGNQQRVVVAKWLALKPKLLILNCPTVGVDIGSKGEIHAMTHEFAAQGIGVILISDDLPEILSACNRVLVMHHGEITSCFNTNEISENEIYKELVKA
jgi:simple sugar transport system ATP-binding protein